MRFPHPGQRSVAPWGAPPKASAAALACGPPTQGSASGCSRMRIPHTGQRFVASYGSSTKGPSGCSRTRSPHPGQRFAAP
eukprot:5911809-Pyramimonas_sp.AAC.1